MPQRAVVRQAVVAAPRDRARAARDNRRRTPRRRGGRHPDRALRQHDPFDDRRADPDRRVDGVQPLCLHPRAGYAQGRDRAGGTGFREGRPHRARRGVRLGGGTCRARLPDLAVPLALHQSPEGRVRRDFGKQDALHADVPHRSDGGRGENGDGRIGEAQHVRRVQGRHRDSRKHRHSPRDRTLRCRRHRAFGRVRVQGPDGRDAGADPDLHDELLLAPVAALFHPLVRALHDPAVSLRGVLFPGRRQEIPRRAEMPWTQGSNWCRWPGRWSTTRRS